MVNTVWSLSFTPLFVETMLSVADLQFYLFLFSNLSGIVAEEICTFKWHLCKFPKFSFSVEISGQQQLCAEVALANKPVYMCGASKIVTDGN